MKRKQSVQSSRQTKAKTSPAKNSSEVSRWVIRPIVRTSLNTLDDLVSIAWNYKETDDSFDWTKLWLMVPVLTELKNIIGMKDLKDRVVDLVAHSVRRAIPSSSDYFHTIISGPQGCGKTKVANIIARIYRDLGLLNSAKILTVKRDELTGTHSDKNVRDLLERARGMVLLIDESSENAQRGSEDFSSVLDALNKHLPEMHSRDSTICIVCGNDGETEKYSFGVCSGSKTKFPWRLSIFRYSAEEMLDIFKSQVKKEGWGLDVGAVSKQFFIKNSTLFPAYGRDISNLLLMCKVVHNRRTFGTNISNILTEEDVSNGFVKYKDMKNNNLQEISYIS